MTNKKILKVIRSLDCVPVNFSPLLNASFLCYILSAHFLHQVTISIASGEPQPPVNQGDLFQKDGIISTINSVSVTDCDYFFKLDRRVIVSINSGTIKERSVYQKTFHCPFIHDGEPRLPPKLDPYQTLLRSSFRGRFFVVKCSRETIDW